MIRTTAAIVLAAALLSGCGKGRRMKSANEIFEAELRARSVAFTGPDDQGLYKLQSGDGKLTVSLENIARNYERDGDPEAIHRFVDQTLRAFDLPEWERAQALLFFSVEPTDHQFGDTIHWSVSGSTSKVLVLTDLQEARFPG